MESEPQRRSTTPIFKRLLSKLCPIPIRESFYLFIFFFSYREGTQFGKNCNQHDNKEQYEHNTNTD